jgi:uncharacterized membrane protein
MNQIKVSAKRHLAKTVSYRIISTLIGFLIMWAVSGSITIGAAFGVAELVYKPIQYYIHERIWYRYIKYGLIKVKEEKPKEEEKEEPKTKRLVYTKKAN